jgi:hypothetical protein
MPVGPTKPRFKAIAIMPGKIAQAEKESEEFPRVLGHIGRLPAFTCD